MKTFKNTVAAYCGITAVLLLGFAVLCGCTGAAGDEDNKPVQQEISIVDKDEGNEVVDTDVLDEETERQIKHDYVYGYLRPVWTMPDFNPLDGIEQVRVERYLGTYQGNVAVEMDPSIPGSYDLANLSYSLLEIADLIIIFHSAGTRIYVWKQGGNAAGGFYKPRDIHDLTSYKEDIMYKEGIVNERVRDAHDAGLLPFYELRDAYDLGMVTADDVKNIADRYWKGMPISIEEIEKKGRITPVPRYPTIFTPEELEELAQTAQ